jgi:hypothetical protein
MKNRKGQEEMIGFGLIVALVMVILLVFLWFSISRSSTDPVESYEVESFLKASMQCTTDCEHSVYGNLEVQDLIFWCYEFDKKCLDGGSSCDVLNNTLKTMTAKAFRTGEDAPVKGYLMEIEVEGRGILSFSEGNLSGNMKGSTYSVPKSGDLAKIGLSLYY